MKLLDERMEVKSTTLWQGEWSSSASTAGKVLEAAMLPQWRGLRLKRVQRVPKFPDSAFYSAFGQGVAGHCNKVTDISCCLRCASDTQGVWFLLTPRFCCANLATHPTPPTLCCDMLKKLSKSSPALAPSHDQIPKKMIWSNPVTTGL